MTGDPSDACVRALIDRLFIFLRTLSVHGGDHPLARDSAATVTDAFAAAAPPYALQFIDQALFVNCRLVPLEPAGFQRSVRLAALLARMQVNELAVEHPPDAAALLAFGRALALGRRDPPEVPGLRLRRIRDVRHGRDAVRVDPDLFAVAQVTRALVDAEAAVARSTPWRWHLGIAVVRRLERALAAHRGAALRFIDLAPGPWSVPRRAVAATLHALAVLGAAEAALPTLRAAAHATLCVAAHGLRSRQGARFGDAVETALAQLLASAAEAHGDADPHRLRVCAILHSAALRPEAPRRWHPVTRLVATLYAMEWSRCPAGVELHLGAVDLLMTLVEPHAQETDPAWIAALVAALGTLPPGARVRLPDGRIGAVLGAGVPGDPSRPRVYVQGRVVLPEGPVRLAGP